MGLRIWHQSSTVLKHLPHYEEALRAHSARAVRPDTEVVLHGKVAGTHASGYPGNDTRYSLLYAMHGLQWIAAAREAQREGYDAIVFANLLSPMIREIRTIVDIPAIGYGETAFHLSGLYGRKIGVLLFNIELQDFIPELMHQSGVGERFAGIGKAGVSFGDVADSLEHPSRRRAVIDTIVEAGRELSERVGADVIIPGETPMALLLAIEKVDFMGDAAVIDGIAAAFKTAEMLVDLRKLSGMRPSRRGFFHSRPEAGRVEEIMQFYGLADFGSRFHDN